MHRVQLDLATIFAAALLHGQTTEAKDRRASFQKHHQLKGTPADQLVPAMTFIAASLGVECYLLPCGRQDGAG